MTAERPRAIDTLLVAVFAAAVHFTVFAIDRKPLDDDSPRYITLAHSLLDDHRFYAPDLVAHAAPADVFRIGPPAPETIRTPGYPLFLALIFALGGGLRTAIFIQHLIVIALAVAVQRFAALHVDRIAGIAAGLMMSVFPALVFFSNRIMSDALMLAFLSIALAMLIRPRPAIAGIAFGIAILIRPIALYFPIVFLLVKRSKAALVFGALALVLPIAWAARNFHETGVATVSSIDGENLLLYRAAGTLVVADKAPGEGWFSLQQQTGFFDRALRLRSPLIRKALAGAHAANHAQRARAYSREAFAILAAHPFAYAKLAASGVVALWIEDFAWPLAEAGVPRRLSYAIFVPFSLLLISLAIYGIRHVEPQLALLIAMTILYFTIISAGAEAHPRFTIPYLPAYAIAIGAGVSAAIRRRS